MRKNPVTNRDDGELAERGLRELTDGETILVGGGFWLPRPDPCGGYGPYHPWPGHPGGGLCG